MEGAADQEVRDRATGLTLAVSAMMPVKSLSLILERVVARKGTGILSYTVLPLVLSDAGLADIVNAAVGPCMLVAGIVGS